MAYAPPTYGVTPPKKKKKPEMYASAPVLDKGVYSSVFPKAGKPAYPTKAASWSAAPLTALTKSPVYSATPQPTQGAGAGYQSDLAKIQARKQAAIRMKRRNINRNWR
jgi:hypothetical protein